MSNLTHLREIVNPNAEIVPFDVAQDATVKPSGILMKIWHIVCEFIGVLSSADAEKMKEAFIRAFLS